jgi:hypothetical protein
VSADPRPIYAALRRVLQAHGGGAGALAGLAELASVLHGRQERGPGPAARWLQEAHPGLGGRTPLDVWLAGRVDRVIDAARAEVAGEA